MLDRVKPETWVAIASMIIANDLVELSVTSLWRPGGDVHTAGRGFDWGKATDGWGREAVNMRANRTIPESNLSAEIRILAKNCGMISEWLTPWRLNEEHNNLDTPLGIQHNNHGHATVRPFSLWRF
jgi:hypothetical protein